MKVRARKAELGDIDGTNWQNYKKQVLSILALTTNQWQSQVNLRIKRQDLELYNICFLPGSQQILEGGWLTWYLNLSYREVSRVIFMGRGTQSKTFSSMKF